MPTIRFEASCPGESGGATSAIDARIEDVRLAVSILVGAASKAEEALAILGVADRAATHWSQGSVCRWSTAENHSELQRVRSRTRGEEVECPRSNPG
jgi:hypothetical protein